MAYSIYKYFRGNVVDTEIVESKNVAIELCEHLVDCGFGVRIVDQFDGVILFQKNM